MASPFVEHHLPRLARILVELALSRGVSSVEVAEVAALSGVPFLYVRTIGLRYLADVNQMLAEHRLSVTVHGGSWLLRAIQHAKAGPRALNVH